MLLGRTAERAAIDRLLRAAREGVSGALVVSGEPGIGKTALLDEAVARAGGMTILRARGLESESELPFSGLSELLVPYVDRIHEIPDPQAAALEAALALGPPVAADRFAVAAGTLSVLALMAEERPVLVVADDAQWLDGSSLEALSFTARRIQAEGIAVLFGLRREEDAVVEIEGIEEIVLSGLDPTSSETLLKRDGRRTISPDVARRIHELTRGNPLALLEMSSLLTDEQLAGVAIFDDPLPVGQGLERAFLRRAQGLDGDASIALTVLAVIETGEIGEIKSALAVLGVDAAHLSAIEECGLIDVRGERIEWRHPLYRGAAYHRAAPAIRRKVHAAIAEVLTEGSARQRRIWHLAASTVGPDAAVAAALEGAARDARGRLSHASAAAAFERSAKMTPDAELRARRSLEAARDLLLLGRHERAIEVLDHALEGVSDPLLRAEIEHQRGSALMWVIGPSAAREILVTEAEKILDVDPDRAATMLAEASVTYTMSGEIDASFQLARRAEKVASSGAEPVQIATAALVGGALVLKGNATEGRPLVLRSRRVFDAIDPLGAHPLVHPLAHVGIWLEEYDLARHVLERIIEAGRRTGAIGLLAYPLGCLSELEFRMGRWSASYAAGLESVEYCSERRLENQLSYSLVCLGMVEAGLGRERDCRAHVARALEVSERFATHSLATYANAALGFLELGRGHPSEAIGHLEKVADLVEEHGVSEPGVIEWAPELITAYAALGRTEDAEASLARFEVSAERTERISALAAAARCRGMLEPSGSFEKHFESAFRLLDGIERPFERARTELELGRRLRRERRPVDARVPLRHALGTFESIGARPWAEKARSELVAAGGEPRRASRAKLSIQELGPQELQIAMLVADGLTNREIAAALFLSPKTVEFHLGKMYRKLSIRSRTDLARLVTGATGHRG